MKKGVVFLSFGVSGLMLALSFPPMPFFILAFAAFVPILFILEQNVRIKRKFLLLYLTFFIYHGGTNWWISSWQPHADPYLLVSGIAVGLVHPLFFLLPFAIYFFIRKKLGSSLALWLFPAIWTAYEWFRTFGDLAYPWLSIGYTQVYSKAWIQFVDITGVWGASFVICLINVLIVKIMLASQKSVSTGEFIKSKSFKLLVLSLAAAIILPMGYGWIRIAAFDHNDLLKSNDNLRIGIVQPNINPWVKWESSVFDQIDIHLRLQDSLIKAAGPIDLAVWSETSVHYINIDFNANHNFHFLQNWLDRSNTSLLTGFADIYILKPGELNTPTSKKMAWDTTIRFDSFNSALMLNPTARGKRNPQIYHKMKLTPFGESIPYVEYLSFARQWLEWGVGISSWSKGKEQFNLIANTGQKEYEIGSIICIESVYPGFVRGFTDKGAEILTVITNDGWYDNTFGPEQHYQIAVMRAIENRRYIARCANTGVSGFIAANGNDILKAEQYKSLATVETVPTLKEKSFYVIVGDWLPFISSIITALIFIMALFKRNPNVI